MMTEKLRAAAQAALEWLRDELLDTWADMDRQFYKDCAKHTKALEAALAEPAIKESLTVAEPVACIGTNGELMWLKKPEVIYSKPRPLYTAPPRREWVGLTDDEITKLHHEIKVQLMGTYKTEDIYRAIETKLRKKNK